MSEDDPNSRAELVPAHHGALALTSLADNPILSEMIDASLVPAKDSAIAHVGVDALVHEAKHLYRYRDGITEENTKAFNLYSRAAMAGHNEAQYCVGWCYLNGDGIPKNYAQAVKSFTKLAKEGFAKAQLRLGFLYQGGVGVSKDEDEAIKWYKRAAEQGLGIGFYFVAITYAAGGKGVPQDCAESAKWYRKGAEQGDLTCQEILAARCWDGYDKSIPQDYVEAAKWYRAIAERGNAEMQCRLAHLYTNGQGVPCDMLQAYMVSVSS